ncbi:MAG: hypothetical protein ACT4TC_25875 [Myxococcaceae bacterium]
MTYDLYLFRPEPDVEPRAVIEGLLSAGDGLVLRRMLASKDPRAQRQAQPREVKPPTQSVPVAGDTLRRLHPLLEGVGQTLRDPRNGIEIELKQDYVAVTLPFSHTGPAARKVFENLGEYLGVLERDGFETFDPQVDRVIHLPQDLDAVLRNYLGSADTIAEKTIPAKKPWWKRW